MYTETALWRASTNGPKPSKHVFLDSYVSSLKTNFCPKCTLSVYVGPWYSLMAISDLHVHLNCFVDYFIGLLLMILNQVNMFPCYVKFQFLFKVYFFQLWTISACKIISEFMYTETALWRASTNGLKPSKHVFLDSYVSSLKPISVQDVLYLYT